MNAALVALGPPAVAVGVVRDLRTTGQVRLEAVFGVLSLYILIGMAFGFVYGAIDQLGGDPFFAGGQAATVSHCLYFSFTTLATVGYGDFVARTDLGHTLAVSEALMGQIYLVTVVSLIVSNLARPRAGRETSGGHRLQAGRTRAPSGHLATRRAVGIAFEAHSNPTVGRGRDAERVPPAASLPPRAACRAAPPSISFSVGFRSRKYAIVPTTGSSTTIRTQAARGPAGRSRRKMSMSPTAQITSSGSRMKTHTAADAATYMGRT